MSSFGSTLFTDNFQSTLQMLCGKLDWEISELRDKSAALKFSMDSGRTQVLFIMVYGTTLEFSVPSEVVIAPDKKIPDFVSTMLMKRNRERKIGFWCLEQIKEKWVFSAMHNAEAEHVTVEYFAKIVRALISECDEFEEAIGKVL